MESSGSIDPISNIKNHKFYLFSGTQDWVVFQGVMRKLQQQLFETFQVPTQNIVADFSTPAEHAFITNDYCNQCGYFGSPWINNCGIDQAKVILETTLSIKLNNSSAPVDKNLFTFNQNGTYSAQSFDEKGYVYIPTSCQQNRVPCSVHLVFHGCNQGMQSIGDVFVKHSGYLKHAEGNNIVFLFPQVKKDGEYFPNPQGCYDWWGYTSQDFANKNGVQMKAIANMIADLGVNVQ